MTRKMKDSGVEWIGEIPEDWEIIKVKQLFKIGRGRVIAKTELDEKYPYPVYSSQTKNDGILGYIQTYDFEGPRLTWTTDGANAGTVFIRDGKYNCTNVCGTLELKDEINDLQYLKYTLEYIAIFHKRADTNGYKIMNNEMANIEIVLPSEHKQKAIADFLDKKTKEINNIISKSKKAIEEYKKYKQSLITETVTKGLDENVEMKDSGIEWIGEIPEHWDVRKLKNISLAFGSGTTPTTSNDKYYGGNISWIQSGDLYNRNVIQETSKCITETAVRDISTLKVYEKPFIVVAMYGASVGNTCISNINACVNQACCIIKPIGDLYYYYYCILTAKDYLLSTTSGGSQPNISQEKLKNLYIPRPNKWEQEQIAAYLDQKCTQIDQIISTKENLLAEMEAYKKSLIYETVTGKREVE